MEESGGWRLVVLVLGGEGWGFGADVGVGVVAACPRESRVTASLIRGVAHTHGEPLCLPYGGRMYVERRRSSGL